MRRIDTPLPLIGPGDNFTESLVKPCLSECKRYRRLTGWFSSSILNRWHPALNGIVKNETKLEIIIGGKDKNFQIFDRIKDLKTDKEKTQEVERLKNDILLASLKPEIDDKDVFNDIVRYLFANHQLEFKVSFVANEKGLDFDHGKIGYFEFFDNEIILFHGSANESQSAFLTQGENLEAISSRDENKKTFNYYYDLLRDLWDGDSEVVAEKWQRKVVSPDEKFIKQIRETNNLRDRQDLENALEQAVTEWEKRNGLSKVQMRKLRPYQKDAIQEWNQNNCRGILEHATGSGKTFTALNAVKDFYKDWPIVVIGVPYQMLADQWVDESEKFFKERDLNFNIIECWSENKNWPRKAKDELIDRENKITDKIHHLSVFVVVNESLKNRFHSEIIEDEFFDLKKTIFIGDECHNYNTPLLETSFPEYEWRLGLSATPIVDKNDYREGEKKMEEFFGGIIHEFTLSDALNAKPEPFLCQYNYFPIECLMSEDDFEDWYEDFKITGWQADDDTWDDAKKAAYSRMNNILGSMDSKYEEFGKLLIKNKSDKKNSIVFCGQGTSKGRDIERAVKILKKNDWDVSSIVHSIGGKEQKKIERKKIIENFIDNGIDAIAAIKVLDEGIDVPSIKTAYIIASTKNRRQFVQRRGRVLRKSSNKNFAVIYDFVVQPPFSAGDKAKKLVENEIMRMEELGKDAMNLTQIEKFINNYKINNNV